MEWPHVVRVRQAEILVEAMTGRQKLRMMSQVPLAEDGRGITALFHQLRDRHFIRMDTMPRTRTERARDADAIRITAGEERSARCGADGLRHVEVREPPSFAREAVQVRRLISACAEDSDVGVAQIVGEYDNDVRRAGCRRDGRGGCRHRQHQQHSDGES
jgi:hypothetical protein